MHKEFYHEYYQIEDKHWWFIGRREIFLRVLDRHLPPAPDRARRILDVGCGTGTMLQYLARYGQAEGVDMDADAVRFCRERGVTQVQQHLADRPLPFLDETFDLITLLDVLEHIEDDRGTLRGLHRLLRPGGSLLVAVPAFRFLWGPQDEISGHKRRYVAAELRARLAESGFTLQHLSYFNTFLFPVIAGVRVLRPYRPGAADLKSDFTLTRPGPANSVLARLFAAEAPLVRRWNLPVGVSILALARKPPARS